MTVCPRLRQQIVTGHLWSPSLFSTVKFCRDYSVKKIIKGGSKGNSYSHPHLFLETTHCLRYGITVTHRIFSFNDSRPYLQSMPTTSSLDNNIAATIRIYTADHVIHDAMVMIGVRLPGKQEVKNELARHFPESFSPVARMFNVMCNIQRDVDRRMKGNDVNL